MKRINKNILKQIIVESREFIKKIPAKFVERESFQLPGSVKKVVIIYGVRRSGKTYLLYHLLKENPDHSLYIDFEDERLEGFSQEDFETLRQAFYELFPHLVSQKVYFLFDEIQEVEGWEKFCRRIAEKTPGEVFVAGSFSKIHPENISTTLRGRAWRIELFPFSFKEFLAFKEIKPDDLLLASEERFRIMEFLNEYLKWGGFPEVVAAKSEFEKQKIIKEYLDAIFFKDLVERYEISNIPLISSLKGKIFSTFSTKFSLNAFYNKTKGSFPISRDLLYRYYYYLLESRTVFEVRKYSDSEYKRARNPAKVYIIDPALAQKVAHDDFARVLENVVFIELLRRNYRAHYFTNGSECDFIAVKDNESQAIQVTYQLEEANREREFNGIKAAISGIRKDKGYILTYDEEGDFISEGITIKVAAVWKWLLATD